MKRSFRLVMVFLAIVAHGIGCGTTLPIEPSTTTSTGTSGGGGAGGTPTTSSSTASSSSTGGTGCVSVDDGNACTDDLCTAGVPTHTFKPQGTARSRRQT